MNSTEKITTGVFNELAPANSLAYAEEVMQKYYGIKAMATELACERDQILLLEDAQSIRYILRFINPAEERKVSNFQTETLLHIAKVDPNLPIPKVILTLNGEGEVALPNEDGRSSIVRLITCLSGIAASKLSARSVELHRDMGWKLARLDLALKDFSHSAARYDLVWDLERAMEVQNLLVHIQDDWIHDLAINALENYKKNVLPVLSGLRRQIIHNDFNFSNIMIDEKRPHIVAGIIDFGDAIESPLINEVAVSLSYQVNKQAGSLIPCTNFITGYHQTNTLLPEEKNILYDLILTRAVMTIAISEWRAKQFSVNRDFVLKNNFTARTALKLFSDLGRENVNLRLSLNC